MKKIVLLSLLVLSFPAVTFADTSDSVPDDTVSSKQEQIIDSASISAEASVDSHAASPAISKETQQSKEAITEEPEPVSEETSTDTAAIDSAADKTENSETDNTAALTTNTPNAAVPEAPKTAVAATQAAPKVETSQIVVEKEAVKEWTPDKIRENLKVPDYGISRAELQGYTDQELTNAFKLFVRYNFDFSGMDLGSYVRVL